VTPEKIVKSKRFVSQLEKLHKAKRLHRIAVDVRAPHRPYDDEGGRASLPSPLRRVEAC